MTTIKVPKLTFGGLTPVPVTISEKEWETLARLVTPESGKVVAHLLLNDGKAMKKYFTKEYRDSKLYIVKAVKEDFKIGLKEAKDIVDLMIHPFLIAVDEVPIAIIIS